MDRDRTPDYFERWNDIENRPLIGLRRDGTIEVRSILFPDGSIQTSARSIQISDLLASVGIYILTITATASAPAPGMTLMFTTDSALAMPVFATTDPTTITVFGKLSLMVLDNNGTLTALDISGNPTLQSFSYSGGA
jgi:hypothetical protein